MKKTTDDCLINKLKEGNNLNITLLSNSEYWSEVQNLAEHFANCNVLTFDPYSYFINLSDSQKVQQIGDSDLIIFSSSDFFNENYFSELKNIAYGISNEKNKRVSIGYLYHLPKKQRPYESVLDQIEIVSYKNGTEITEKTYPTPHFTVYDLVELTMATVNEYSYENQRKLEKKCSF